MSVEGLANSNLHVMRFLGLTLEDDMPDYSVLSRFRMRLTAVGAWDSLLEQMNRQIQLHNIVPRHILQAIAYNLKRLPNLFIDSQLIT